MPCLRASPGRGTLSYGPDGAGGEIGLGGEVVSAMEMVP